MRNIIFKNNKLKNENYNIWDYEIKNKSYYIWIKWRIEIINEKYLWKWKKYIIE